MPSAAGRSPANWEVVGVPDGAIDTDWDEAEQTSREQLEAALAEVETPHSGLGPGDVAIDLVTRQPLYVVDRPADTLAEYHEVEGFDLATYKAHPWLPVSVDDAVLTCVFIGDVESLHSFSNTYDYPAGRLARVPVERAGGDE